MIGPCPLCGGQLKPMVINEPPVPLVLQTCLDCGSELAGQAETQLNMALREADYATLLAVYRSGQMSEAQLQRHLKDALFARWYARHG